MPEPKKSTSRPGASAKVADLAQHTVDKTGTRLTTDQGLPLSHTDDSLKAGRRGPTLLEDAHLREKITRFDHERIPERVVHARGSGAHGVFRVYESMATYTRAGFLQDPRVETPVFVRFSTVAGSRGSADTVRDARGFAVKFYTNEGNFDLVGNNIPVFFIQDGIKFPDLVHALKPEPDNEMPQAASAHDNFWDFVSLVPETAHMVMWVMSDRGIPRSYRTMEGFGVHTFRLVNAAGDSHLVKFHWKPVAGMQSLVWDESQELCGRDPDFHRRDLWEAIESGKFPEYELGIQVFDEADQLKYGFDLLDPTKLVPEELVPVELIGRMTLKGNPKNFFAETEQAAFHVGNLVPGIDVSNDPLLQVRLFSYVDTQLTRLGGPNFAELPINRPLATVANHQQDGFGNQRSAIGKANYHPNSIGGGDPALTLPADGGYHNYEEPIEGTKVRLRSDTFHDHFGQATLFYKSQSPAEQAHLTSALQFELSKVTRPEVRQRVVAGILANIDAGLAAKVAAAIGVTELPVDAAPASDLASSTSPALSIERSHRPGIAGLKVAALLEDGFEDADLAAVRKALTDGGATFEIVSGVIGPRTGRGGASVAATQTLATAASVMYDAVFVPGGAASVVTLSAGPEAARFVEQTYRHFKTVGVSGEASSLLPEPAAAEAPGVVTGKGGRAFADAFVEALSKHRHWTRPAGVGAPAPR